MHGPDEQTQHIFSYLSLEQRVPTDHPLRAIRALTDEALRAMSPQLERLYATPGRPSIPPDQLPRALLICAVPARQMTSLGLALFGGREPSARRRRLTAIRTLISDGIISAIP